MLGVRGVLAACVVGGTVGVAGGVVPPVKTIACQDLEHGCAFNLKLLLDLRASSLLSQLPQAACSCRAASRDTVVPRTGAVPEWACQVRSHQIHPLK